MASQRVFVFALGGNFAESLAKDLSRFQAARTTSAKGEWSSEDWPQATRDELDSLLHRLIATAFEPPVLYRSEHVDLWSMGNVYSKAIAEIASQEPYHLLTDHYEVHAAHIDASPSRITFAPSPNAASEYHWLATRLKEAVSAWKPLVDSRLILLIRIPQGGLWTDEEVANSLTTIPKHLDIRK